MSEQPRRPRSEPHRGVVQSTEWLTPHMVRVYLGGDGLQRFAAGEYTDHYVKLIFDSGQERPLVRTYTVRSWDGERRELAIDFVVHGDEGVAAPWAAKAQPGDEILFSGPGGGYAPDPDADWHLLAGDESALPAIAAALESLPAGATATVFIEVPDVPDQQPIESAAEVDVVWLFREDRKVGALLVDQVKAAAFPPGRGQFFVHGEATFVKELRAHLRVDRGIDRTQQSISGYWRLGLNEDGWQSSKRDWNAAAEQEEAKALGLRA
jgi:NADPH-dependent ferric siderophore reductase